MQSVVRGLVAFGLAGALSGLGLARLAIDRIDRGLPPLDLSVGSFYEYRFDELEVLEQTVFHVDEKYVDPSRLDWEAMFVAVLDAAERRAPACVFSREPGGTKVTVEVGEFLTVLEIDPIRDHRDLVDATRQIARILAEHLDERDLPVDDPAVGPWRELEYAMVNGMLHTVLDPHSSLLPPQAADEMDTENQGQFGGLGVSVGERGGWLVVEEVLDGLPAAQVGLQKGDRIVRIDGESTLNLSTDDAVSRLRGALGSAVTLLIARESRPEPFEVDIVRGTIPYHPVVGKLLDGGVAYLRIQNFHAEAEPQLRDQLDKLQRDAGGSLRGVVLDLRENPGGFYHSGWQIADAFLEEGVLVSTVDREGRTVERKEARVSDTEPMVPMAVLVNAKSASASEIVAGALRNHDRAVIIGQRSFGKGSVQNLHEYHDGSKLKLTVSRYLTPGERSIQAVGIPADIELQPVVLGPKTDPLAGWVGLHGSELVTREVDLPGALDAQALVTERPAWSFPYLYDGEASDEAESDFEVGLARDVLLAAPSWRRAEVLAAASRVVTQHARAAEADVERALTALGLDWRAGPDGPVDSQPLTLRLESGPLIAGRRSEVKVVARNAGSVPISRAAAVVTEHDVLEGAEFLFGRLEPGEERAWTVHVTPPTGYPHEIAPMVVSIRDGGARPLGEARLDVEIQGAEPAVLDWSASFRDGDGDGTAEVGERVDVAVSITNHGLGPAVGVVLRAKNQAGRALDLVHGSLSVGDPRDPDGVSCDPERVERCRHVLDPGATWEGVLSLDVRERPTSGEVGFDLTIERRVDYDWAAIARAELGDLHLSTESLVVPIDRPLPPSFDRQAPRIEITTRPELVTGGSRVVVSGRVTDDRGVAHVMVFAGADKVFHQGAGRNSTLRAIPFTAEVAVEPGVNTLVVQAVDADGVVSTRSVVTVAARPELAQAPAAP